MGLLEDAIREHLELKRLRGADPAEVAREQHEALDPPAGQDPTAAADDHAPAPAHEADAAAHGLDDQVPTTDDRPDDVPPAPIASDLSQAGQETAELDMQAVLADEPTAADHAVPADSPLADGLGAPEVEEDSLEWEVPLRPPLDPDSPHGLPETHDDDAHTPDEHVPPAEAGDHLEDGHAGAGPNIPGQGRLSL
jgi:hypothetical protein